MSFAADYCSAYRSLRTGVEPSKFDRAFFDKGMEYVKSRLLLNANVLRPINRVKAVLYAFSIAKEMRRQRLLVRGLFNIKEEQPKQTVYQRDITLFPITINKTTVKMVDKEDI